MKHHAKMPQRLLTHGHGSYVYLDNFRRKQMAAAYKMSADGLKMGILGTFWLVTQDFIKKNKHGYYNALHKYSILSH